MKRIIDLTRTLTERSLSYPGTATAVRPVQVDIGAPGARLTQLSFFDLHAGTHIDAPLHFVPGGTDVASLGILLFPGIVVRAQTRSIPAEILGNLPIEGRAVLFDTGWQHDLASPSYHTDFAFISAPLAQALVERGATLVGIDTPSVDAADAAPDYTAHRTLLNAGIPIVEGLCHLDRLADPQAAWDFAVFPLALAGVEGAPARAVALLSD
jgi:kynurenine formamidase